MKRILALILSYLFLIIAIIGIFLPIMPTVPFLLLSAWFAARGSESLHQWLYAHPIFGQLLIDWEQHGIVTRSSKILAILMLMISWGFMFYRVNNVWVILLVTLALLLIALFLMTRPEKIRQSPP